MSNNLTKNKVISSLFWKLMERGGTQGLQFVIQLILARLLLPAEYGIIAIVNVFILLANVFVQSGLNTSLIQKKDADELDFSTVFYFSLLIAVLLYVLLFFLSPFIAKFYNFNQLMPVIRVLSLTLFFGAINSIQNAYIAREMLFKKLFLSSLLAILISGSFGIAAAYMGLGIWALVIQQLSNQLVISLILWFTVKWRPKLLFSYSRLKVLLSYGWKLLLSSLLNTLYTDFRTIFIGRVFNASVLGFYNRGRQFPQVLVTNINGSIQSVMLPALSLHQDNIKRVKDMMRRSIMTTAFLIFPMMVGLFFIAEPLIVMVLTEKWLPAVPFLQISCFIFALRPVNTANVQAINAIGRSDIVLKIEILRTIMGVVTLLITIPLGVYAVAIGELINAIISTFIYCYPNSRLIKYSYFEQLKDILSPAVLSLIMGGIVYIVGKLVGASALRIVLQIISGISTYFILSKIFKVKSYTYLINTGYSLISSKARKFQF